MIHERQTGKDVGGRGHGQIEVSFRYMLKELRYTMNRPDITQRKLVIMYRRFGITHWSHLRGSRIPRSRTSLLLKMGSIGYPETSLRKTHFTLRNIPEDRRFHLHHGGSLKLRVNRPVRGSNDPVEIRTRHLPNISRGHDSCIKSFGGPVLM